MGIRHAEQTHDMIKMYKAEKALHETINSATANLKHAMELKKSLEPIPQIPKSTARSNVSSKRQRAIKIVEAMQSRIKPQKLKKEHWQKTYNELMESSAPNSFKSKMIMRSNMSALSVLTQKFVKHGERVKNAIFQ